VVAHTCNPKITGRLFRKKRSGGSQLMTSPDKKLARPHFHQSVGHLQLHKRHKKEDHSPGQLKQKLKTLSQKLLK
jgi:hypothetical protein